MNRVVLEPTWLYRRAIRLTLVNSGVSFHEHPRGLFVIDTTDAATAERALRIARAYGLELA